MVRESRQRLTGQSAFEAVFREGRRRDGDYLQIVSTAAALERGRVGFVIGRRALPRAVDRNRIRRMLRAVLARARPGIDTHDVIVRLKRTVDRAVFPAVVAEAERMLATLAGCGSVR